MPVVGSVLSIWNGVAAERSILGNQNRITELEARLSRFERGQRDLVQGLVGEVLADLQTPTIAPAALTASLRELSAIREQDFLVGIFEGLLQGNPHYPELQRNPTTYGRLLKPSESLSPDSVPIFIDVEGTPRVLEVRLFTLQQLLAAGTAGEVQAAGTGVWGLPTSLLSAQIDALVARAASHGLRLGAPTRPSQQWLMRAEQALKARLLVTSSPKPAATPKPVTASEPVASRALLLYQEGTAEEQVYPFTGDVLTIGRGRDNDIQIKHDSKVSRFHCKMIRRSARFYIEDNSSSVGTLVNGELITERRLFGGEEIIIGETFFRFRIMD